MSSHMNSELTMKQMEAISGGSPAHLAALGAVLAVEKTGALSFYVNLAKNLSDGQCMKNAALNAGKSAGVAGLEED